LSEWASRVENFLEPTIQGDNPERKRRTYQAMLMRTDPFRELDRLTQQVFGTPNAPAAMPIDAYRANEWFVVELDLPGVAPDSIEVTVERNVLTVKAPRVKKGEEQGEMIVSERPYGTFSRQLFLGETLDTEHIEAHYIDGVLTLRIPVAEVAKPKRIEIQSGQRQQTAITV